MTLWGVFPDGSGKASAKSVVKVECYLAEVADLLNYFQVGVGSLLIYSHSSHGHTHAKSCNNYNWNIVEKIKR